MPNPLKYFSKPEYILRPSQTLKRLARIGKPVPELATVRLPWGAIVTVHTGENVGCEIYHHGIFDKIVPEAIWRLLDGGETAVDVGANIGQNTSVMAQRVGSNGLVYAFEPHPKNYVQLKANHVQWDEQRFGKVQIENFGLGSKKMDDAFIYTDSPYLSGSALHDQAPQDKRKDYAKVRVEMFDAFIAEKIGVCKIDVEGHELEVLKGAKNALERHAIRDVIFEDFNSKPSPVTEFLEQHGFAIFELHDGWPKPRLVPLDLKNIVKRGFSSNYLATLDAARAVKRFRSPGWRCLLNL
jgi:FkbM family methyltransferase